MPRQDPDSPSRIIREWGGKIILTILLGTTAFFLEESYRSTQLRIGNNEERIKYIELHFAQAEQDRQALHETMRALQEAVKEQSVAEAAADQRIETKVDRLLLLERERR